MYTAQEVYQLLSAASAAHRPPAGHAAAAAAATALSACSPRCPCKSWLPPACLRSAAPPDSSLPAAGRAPAWWCTAQETARPAAHGCPPPATLRCHSAAPVAPAAAVPWPEHVCGQGGSRRCLRRRCWRSGRWPCMSSVSASAARTSRSSGRCCWSKRWRLQQLLRMMHALSRAPGMVLRLVPLLLLY